MAFSGQTRPSSSPRVARCSSSSSVEPKTGDRGVPSVVDS